MRVIYMLVIFKEYSLFTKLNIYILRTDLFSLLNKCYDFRTDNKVMLILSINSDVYRNCLDKLL